MKVNEIRNRKQEELNSDIELLKRELFNLRFQQMSKKLENTGRFKQVKINIARIKTILRERELGGNDA